MGKKNFERKKKFKKKQNYERKKKYQEKKNVFQKSILKKVHSKKKIHSKLYFKNLNLRKNTDRNFRGNFLKKHLKLYSNPPSWLARNRYQMGTFWKAKDWSWQFWESQPFRFWYVEIYRQRRLNSTTTGISS